MLRNMARRASAIGLLAEERAIADARRLLLVEQMLPPTVDGSMPHTSTSTT
jgi:hypothetical protein